MTTFQFHLPASGDATVTIPLPEELRGEPLKIVLEKEAVQSTEEEKTGSTMADFLRKYTGILKDCDIESVEAMKEDRINYILEKYK